MTADDPTNMVMATITITRELTSDGRDIVGTTFVDGDGDTLALVTTLGMLRMAEDTAIRQAMGEVPEDDDDA